MNSLRRFAHLVSLLAAAPLVIGPLFNPAVGREYGVGLVDKLRLLARMLRTVREVPVLSHLYEHVTMAKAILNVPRAVEGCVVECGTYAGGSTANLSLVCALTGRELEVFDSFEGLPAPGPADEVHTGYHEGQFSASFDTVRANVTRYGAIDVCHFHPGYFDDTLPGFARPCVAAFIDVDLRGSAETCLRHLWPRMVPDGRLFTHEAQELHMAALFFDEPWWRSALDAPAPGLAGAGTGLGLLPGGGAFGSELGYTIKAA
jgi:O-methyltransferase